MRYLQKVTLMTAVLLIAYVGVLSAAAEEQEVAERKRVAPLLEKAILLASEIELLAIKPDNRDDAQGTGRDYVVVDGMAGSWAVAGVSALRDKGAIGVLATSLRASMEETNEFGVPPCFRPRHALRFKRGDETVTLLVCFECWQCYTHGFRESAYFQISHAPERQWTEIFRRAGVSVLP